MAKPYVRLDKSEAAVLLVDHQAGLLSLVRDIDPDKFKNNVLALGDMAKYFGLPTILTLALRMARTVCGCGADSAVPGRALYCLSGEYQWPGWPSLFSRYEQNAWLL